MLFQIIESVKSICTNIVAYHALDLCFEKSSPVPLLNFIVKATSGFAFENASMNLVKNKFPLYESLILIPKCAVSAYYINYIDTVMENEIVLSHLAWSVALYVMISKSDDFLKYMKSLNTSSTKKELLDYEKESKNLDSDSDYNDNE